MAPSRPGRDKFRAALQGKAASTRFRGQVMGLIVQVAVSLRTNDVDAAHRLFVLLSRSSSRRCFSCQ
jgi:hypothetical protein